MPSVNFKAPDKQPRTAAIKPQFLAALDRERFTKLAGEMALKSDTATLLLAARLSAAAQAYFGPKLFEHQFGTHGETMKLLGRAADLADELSETLGRLNPAYELLVRMKEHPKDLPSARQLREFTKVARALSTPKGPAGPRLANLLISQAVRFALVAIRTALVSGDFESNERQPSQLEATLLRKWFGIVDPHLELKTVRRRIENARRQLSSDPKALARDKKLLDMMGSLSLGRVIPF